MNTQSALTTDILQRMRELDAEVVNPDNSGTGEDERCWNELVSLFMDHQTELFDLAEEALRRRENDARASD